MEAIDVRDKIYTDKQYKDIKMELTIRKVFRKYREYRAELLYTVVDRMMASNGYDTQPRRPGWSDKLGAIAAYYLDKERYVEFIDTLMLSLDRRSRIIIDNLYCSEVPPTKEYIYSRLLKVSKRHYYRLEYKAKCKMYDLLAKNYEKLKI